MCGGGLERHREEKQCWCRGHFQEQVSPLTWRLKDEKSWVCGQDSVRTEHQDVTRARTNQQLSPCDHTGWCCGEGRDLGWPARARPYSVGLPSWQGWPLFLRVKNYWRMLSMEITQSALHVRNIFVQTLSRVMGTGGVMGVVKTALLSLSLEGLKWLPVFRERGVMLLYDGSQDGDMPIIADITMQQWLAVLLNACSAHLFVWTSVLAYAFRWLPFCSRQRNSFSFFSLVFTFLENFSK